MVRFLRDLRAVWAVATTLCLCACGEPEPRLRNVVLVSLDAVSALHTSAYGYSRETTPHLDQVAEQGTLFRNAYTQQTWTLTSHLTMMTGLYPQAHGASHKRPAHEGATTLAELLQEAGFATAAFTGISGYMRPSFGLGRGFQQYEVGRRHRASGDNGERMNWLEQQAREGKANPDHRFFMFVHSYDAHSDVGTEVPYDAPPRYRNRFIPSGSVWARHGDTSLLKQLQVNGDFTTRDQMIISALYDGGVLFTDQEVLGPLLSKLRSLGLWEETLVIITADHGEEIFEHGFATHQQPYEETARVPLVFSGPGVPAGLRLHDVVELVDLMPTVLSMLSLAIPDHIQGQDLSPLFSGGKVEKNEAYVDGLQGGLPFLLARNKSALIVDLDGERWSYIDRIEPGSGTDGRFSATGPAELYRLGRDPRQLTDVADRRPGVVAGLRKRMLAWYEANQALSQQLAAVPGAEAITKGEGEQTPILSPEELEQLRALGYSHD